MDQKEYRQARFAAPPGACSVILVRHGESRAARPGEPFPLVDGQGDPELAPNGRAQATRVGERLKASPITAIYATKLQRTQETAAPLAEHLGLSIQINPDLHEVHLGEWEGGILRIKAAEGDPIYERMHQEGRWDVIPGAEATEVFRTRLLRGIATIARAHPNEMVAVFVHGGVIGQLLEAATGARGFAFSGADNGSISQVVVSGEQLIVRGFNDATHLIGLADAGGSQLPT